MQQLEKVYIVDEDDDNVLEVCGRWWVPRMHQVNFSYARFAEIPFPVPARSISHPPGPSPCSTGRDTRACLPAPQMRHANFAPRIPQRMSLSEKLCINNYQRRKSLHRSAVDISMLLTSPLSGEKSITSMRSCALRAIT